ncbi:MAG: serine protease [Polaribacter sp.]|nr:MAG: serine protease [Polaribacter sp.]
MKEIVKILAVAFFGGLVAVGGYKYVFENKKQVKEEKQKSVLDIVKTNYMPEIINSATVPNDFTEASEKTIHCVVHVKNTAITEVQNPYDFFFGNGGVQKQRKVGMGSGVIISSDGYIVTNNHVIEGAEDLEITLNNRKKYKAKLIGTDKNNDIALLKIDTDEKLPYLPFGNSDNAKIGEWVLAVGNPYNLTSTVTAGIISAKGRDLQGDANINAFIQTDAAVNPGNSGGALVNTRGELIGINTAITSRTGSFIGYSFAVPSNITKKIIDDILEFGDVQEALLGISYAPNEDEIEGVKITEVTEEGGAEKAGLKKGDIIKKINNVKISKFSELLGQLSAKRPNDKVVVLVERDGETFEKVVTLSKKNFVVINDLGLVVRDLTKSDKKKYRIKKGAKITQNVNPTLKYYGVESGYIIKKINREEVEDALDAKRKLINATQTSRQLYLEVINLNGKLERYGFNN